MTHVPTLPSYNADPKLSREDEWRVAHINHRIRYLQKEVLLLEDEIGAIIMTYQSNKYKADIKAAFDGTYDWSQVRPENRRISKP